MNLIDKKNWGPKPFRSLNVWFSHNKFKEFVDTEWHSLGNISGHMKLKAIRNPIKRWNKHTFGDIEHRIEVFQNQIQNLTHLGDQRDLDEVELARLSALNAECSKWRIRKNQLHRQYSRSKNLC